MRCSYPTGAAMKRVAFLALVSTFGSLACSGVSDPGAIGSPSMSTPDANTPDQTTSVAPDSSSASEAGTAPEAGSPPPDASTGVGMDATTAAADATPDAVTDDVTRVDEGGRDAGAEAGATFTCSATADCVSGAETCCVQVLNGNVTGTCVPGACPNGATSLHCSATADCPTGSECCLTPAGGMGAAAVSVCRAAPCANAQDQLCDPTAADPGCEQGMPVCQRTGAAAGGVAVRLPNTTGVCN